MRRLFGLSPSLFPDAVLCMNTALFYYVYSDRTPAEWHLAVDDGEREFYLLACAKNNYSKRELERQIDSKLFERTIISDAKNEIFLAKSPSIKIRYQGQVYETIRYHNLDKKPLIRGGLLRKLQRIIYAHQRGAAPPFLLRRAAFWRLA
jgi:hypothetical protein